MPAVPQTLSDLIDKFLRHQHTGLDLTQALNEEIIVSWSMAGTAPATAANYGNFFIAPFPLEVLQIQENHTVAGSDAGAVTLTVEKLTGTTALDAGTVLLATAFNLKATANTVQTGTLTTTRTALQMKKGDRLALKDVGTLTDVAGLSITLWLRRM